MTIVSGLDHTVLVCHDIETGIAAYETLFGRGPDWRADHGGAATAIFAVGNTALELMAPSGETGMADRLRSILAARGPGLTSLAFRTDNIETAHRKASRRGLAPGDIQAGSSLQTDTRAERSWRSFRCNDGAMAGIKTFILQPNTPVRMTVAGASCSVQSLDHVVIDTAAPERALINYGARLGLDLALDRTADQWKTRFLFFRTGGLTLEVIHRLDRAYEPEADDHIWGLTWAVDDLAAAHHRLSASGLDVSDIRTGRKPGSTVFSVRSGTLDVPTLFIAHTPH